MSSRTSQPIVGALEKYAIHGGAPPAFACDYLVVGESAYIQVGEVQRGMVAKLAAYPPDATQNMKRSIRALGLAEPETWLPKRKLDQTGVWVDGLPMVIGIRPLVKPQSRA